MAKRGKCRAVKITRGKMKGHYRNPCNGHLARKPRGK